MWFRRRTEKSNPEAAQALLEAQQHLRQVKSRDPEVHQLAEASRKLRRENHFAADLQTMFEGGGRP